MSRSFGTNSGSFESLKRRTRCGAKPCARQMRWTEETLTRAALAIAAPVQWVASCGGSVAVSATTWSMTSWPSGGTRGGRVLSRNRPSTPSAAKRFLPAPDAGLRLARPAHDLDGAKTVRRQQHDLGPPGMLLRDVAVTDDRAQAAAIDGGEGDGDTRAHVPASHGSNRSGIPSWIQSSDLIH